MKDGNHEVLAHIMKSLGNPVRVQILQQLATPRQLGEIEVSPHRREQGGAPKRRMSRAAVQAHLEQLIEVGAVRTMAGVRDGRTVTLYAVDPRQLFALTEELRDLGRIQATAHEADGTAPAPVDLPAQRGPRLILLNGPWEGRVVPLQGPGPWTVGRGAGNTISLPYDPFLSSANSEVHRQADGSFAVVDLPHARNGTALNWTPLERGARTDLVAGDVLGAGRTVLLFRHD